MFIKDSILILPYEQDLTIKSLTNVYTGATNLYLSLESDWSHSSDFWLSTSLCISSLILQFVFP